jgi:hypothetical protein
LRWPDNPGVKLTISATSSKAASKP